MADFRYKPYLKDYLQQKGYDIRNEFINCFHHKEDTPSCKINDDNYYCFGCGSHGDIYDAVNILEGISDNKDQNEFLSKLFGGGYTPSPAITTKKEKFISDPESIKTVENYLNKNPAAEKEIVKFLNMRATVSTEGMIKTYPANIIPAMIKNFLYWPGLDIVRRELGANILFKAGIPLKGKKDEPSLWEHSGVLLKLGKGWKLHYYIEGDCKKYGSKDSHTFPMPGELDVTKPVILTEGEMDAVSANAAGIENIFSCGGTNGLTKPKIEKHEYSGAADILKAQEIIFCFDSDDKGKKASGLMAFDITDKDRTNRPEILKQAGFTGKIRIAELPANEKEKDPDALIIAGKREIILKAINEAREYIPPEKKADEKSPLKWDMLSLKRIKHILKKITKQAIEEKEPENVQIFITAILKACRYPIGIKVTGKGIEKELLDWGATEDQIKNKIDVSPYILIEYSWKYGLSKYLQHIIKIELTPASELLKRINQHKPIVDIDFEEIKDNKNVIQFFDTQGVRAAALMVSDILDGRIIYVESEKKYYFFNGHIWRREPDMTGVIYNIIIAVMRYFYQKDLKELGLQKSDIDELIVKMESRHFRVEIMQEFSQLEQFDIFKTSVLFDGPAVKETLTLIDGVIDFSGKNIIYRKSNKEEYRREILPYTMEQIKKALTPERFSKFIKGSFKNEKTLESLLYYLSLIISRNTKYKYGGVFIGETNTGKTATMDILGAVLPNMIKPIPSEVLVSKGTRQVNGNEATPYTASLEGKGCGLASETGRNLYLNNALWKLLTGGDILPVRDLYEKAREFVPTAQIIILTNYLPLFDSHDNATIQRMIIIPFLITHKRGDEKSVDMDKFKEDLRPEYPGIIKLLVEYYIKLKHEYRGAIPLSEECKKYKQLYIEELDTDLDRFVKDNIEFDVSDDVFEETEAVYKRYLKYYKFSESDIGKEALTQKKFTRYFKRDYKQVVQKQKKINKEPVLCFFNVRLKADTGKTDDPRPEENSILESTKNTPAAPEDDPFN